MYFILLIFCMAISHFIHLLVHGHLGWILWILLDMMNNTAINICIHVSVWAYVFIFPEYIPESGIVCRSQMVALWTVKCFLKCLYHCTFPTVNVESNFSTSKLTFIRVFFYFTHSSGCEIVSHLWILILIYIFVLFSYTFP